MNTQRVGLAAVRRGAKPSLFFTQHVPKLALAPLSTSPPRPVATSRLSGAEARDVLVQQRLRRPVSPHLAIYRVEQTWFGASAWTRITGVALAGSAYAYMAAYLAAPLLGLHLESASVAAAFGALPLLAKAAVKFALGFPFAFHAINGVKHLVYDAGKGFAKPAIRRGEIALWVSSVLGGLYLAVGI